MYSLNDIIDVMEKKGYVVFSDDSKNFNLNIVGIRNEDETANTFNDYMVIFWKYRGQWHQFAFSITTDPGVYWRENPINVNGTAILKPGQYRGMWQLGKHQGKYEALKQVKPVTVYRDKNKNLVLDKGDEETGLFGINHHRATAKKDFTSTQVDKWSAGCQVQPNPVLFDLEMQMFKTAASIWGNSFTYTLLEEIDFK